MNYQKPLKTLDYNMHKPVFLEKSISALDIIPDGIYIDATFGRGGHSKVILESLNDKGMLIAIDKDPEAYEYALKNFTDFRFKIFHEANSELANICVQQNVLGKVNGVLLDLGVSSPQLDNSDRGFSFMRDGPLDMRMDPSCGISAADFVNNTKPEEMAIIFKKFGEEKFARRIANAIGEASKQQPIENTLRLAEIVKLAHPAWEKHKHPATRVFQAIRIHINNELSLLPQVLEQCYQCLADRGRLVVISFHSLEDRIVKNFMRDKEVGIIVPKNIPLPAQKKQFKRLSKAIKPDMQEIQSNIRSRSAVLRIGEKIT